MDLEDVLYRRRTTRKYQPQQVREEELQRLLGAAQTAPLAMGDLRLRKDLLAMLQIPEGYEILSGFVVGYPVNPLQRREKQGKDVREQGLKKRS